MSAGWAEIVVNSFTRHYKQFTSPRRRSLIVRNSRSSADTSPLPSFIGEGGDGDLPAVVIQKGGAQNQASITRQPGASCDAAGLNRRSGQFSGDLT